MKKFMDCKNQIWGYESHNCTIVYDLTNHRFYAECDLICGRRLLTDTNYREVLNDMFYDYCVENASWMGVS